MSEIFQQENWQIDVGGQIYEAEFEELEQWVYEGSLLRQDLVRRGSLRWIEAGRVPSLIQFFNAKENGTAPPVVISNITEAQSTESPAINRPTDFRQNADSPPSKKSGRNNFQEFSNFAKSVESFETEVDFPQFDRKTDGCQIHPEISAFYSCETCANSFCKDCPKSYGANVKICPLCGAMCKVFNRRNANQPQNFHSRAAVSEKFGFGDFAESLIYPFKFKASLIFGTIFFVFFSFGQSSAAFGGFMLFAALICFLGTNMLSFGILANTLENFSQGKINVDFMPDFDSFSIWDDVVQPFFLSIGVYFISFGLFLAILIGGGWYAFNQICVQSNKFGGKCGSGAKARSAQ